MALEKATIRVGGMTCSSCEARVAQALLGLEGVHSARVSLRGGKAEVEFDDSRISLDALRAAIEGAGYSVSSHSATGLGSGGGLLALGIGVALVGAYLLASASGLFAAIPSIDTTLGYGMLVVAGLLTSVHCVAMCGGIALSQGLAKSRESKGEAMAMARGTKAASLWRRLQPGLLYNGGRVLSYTVIGGIVGALGSVFNFSALAKGLLAAAAGLFMVVLGLKMLGILALPRLAGGLVPARLRVAFSRPAAFLRGRGPFAVGLLNGLMPCGPLQTMQLYALGTGSLLAGALSMSLFSLGTVPLMLFFGAAAAFLPRKVVPVMIKASAILVMFLGVLTFGRAAALAGLALPELPAVSLAKTGSAGSAAPSLPKAGTGAAVIASGEGAPAIQAADTAPRTIVKDGVQTITMDFDPDRYTPFVAKAGIPLKWTIVVKAGQLNGCNNPMVVPAYGIKKTLVVGPNLIEFTPDKAGVIAYSCWMGMIRSRITVEAGTSVGSGAAGAPGTAGAAALPVNPASLGLGELFPAGGSCCSNASGGAARASAIDTIGLPTVRNGLQVAEVTVTANGFSPQVVVLQKGMKAVLSFKPAELTSCNNRIVFPEYNGRLDLSKGELETPPITVGADFGFQCWMGMLHGYVKVVDDLSKVDAAKVKAEFAVRPTSSVSAGASCCGGAAKP